MSKRLFSTEPRILTTLSREDRTRVLAACKHRRFDAGQVVFHDGSTADTVHFVIAGHFAAGGSGPDGAINALRVMSPGDVFGEVGLLASGQRRTAAVSALSSAETASLSQSDFAALCRVRPEVRQLTEALLAERVDQLTELLLEARTVDAESRVRRRVAELAAAYGGGQATIAVSQDTIAQLAGTSRATTNKVIGELVARGLVTTGRGTVCVLDEDGLRAAAADGRGG